MPLNPARRTTGFTLVEMLVVLVIIAVLASSVVLSLPDRPEQRLQEEAERLAGLLELAMSLSQSGERQLAWQAQITNTTGNNQASLAQGYSFLAAGNLLEAQRHWQPVIDDTRLRSRTLDDDMALTEVRVDGQPLSNGQLLILRGSDPPLFSMQLRLLAPQGSRRIELRSLPTGRVELTRPAT